MSLEMQNLKTHSEILFLPEKYPDYTEYQHTTLCFMPFTKFKSQTSKFNDLDI
jgi:hypothetical protein